MPRNVYADTIGGLQAAEQNYDAQRDSRTFNLMAADRANRQMALSSYLANRGFDADQARMDADRADRMMFMDRNAALADRDFGLAMADRAYSRTQADRDYDLRRAQEGRLMADFDFRKQHYSDVDPAISLQKEKMDRDREIMDLGFAESLTPDDIGEFFPNRSPAEMERLKVIAEARQRQRLSEAEALAGIRNRIDDLRTMQQQLGSSLNPEDRVRRQAVDREIADLQNYFQTSIRSDRGLSGSIKLDPTTRRWEPAFRVPPVVTPSTPSGPRPFVSTTPLGAGQTLPSATDTFGPVVRNRWRLT